MTQAEFRIGNLVIDEDGTIRPIVSINGNGRIFHDPNLFSEIDTLRGIPLTKESLEKLGFNYNQLYYFIEINNYHFDFVVIIAKKLFGVFLDTDDETQFWIKNILYVHQLQNLYFSLIDKELDTSFLLTQ